MNPVEIGIGKSFKGLAAYLLHDTGRAETAERVAWAQSFNLDAADPEKAWRLMVATALSADALKEAAGIRKGRAAKNTAYHFSLNFNPADDPAEATQRAAVDSALKALGLEKYQALAVAHNDTGHRHVHVMVNLINPENGVSAASKQPDGRAAPLSHTQKKLSQWAQAFEREQGLNVTEGRLANANKRAQGEIVDARRVPRNVYEREKTETQDRLRDFMKRQYEEKAAAISEKSRAMYDRQSIEWQVQKSTYDTEKTALREFHAGQISEAVTEAKAEMKPEWAALFKRHRIEERGFERDDQTALGLIGHAAAVFAEKAREGDALGGLVAAFSKQERRAIMQRRQDRERKALAARSKKLENLRTDEVRKYQRAERESGRVRYMQECAALKARQDAERAEIRLLWQQHSEARKAALSKDRPRVVQQTRAPGRDFGRGRGMEPG